MIRQKKLLKKETGDRRQPTPNPSQEGNTGDRRQEENYLGLESPCNFEHRVDGGVLNPQRK
ncbi:MULTISPECIES: hypothetical protein [Okeania]|uniref:hypothetical protein n=1 Tax=Okeania TaxID=1458928 RepID=UPI000F52A459|nr:MULTISPECIES: hypothetical protein [Okeania]NES90026.1 hypothetical protein [Okeania sp. SIO2B9]NET76164.1 hypothetical protein [Okeania sp. SIO1F9]RQH19377.1 hypothetical protein D4Z78_13840 [Okeania hirsuta]